MRVKEVNDFQSVKDNWNSLLNKSIDNNVFLTWEWLSTWWEHLGEGRKLLILLVEDEKKVVAIAPLMFSEYELPVLGRIKKIEFVGAPQSDYHNFILIEENVECLRRVLTYLGNNFADLNWIELKEIPETSISVDFLRRLSFDISCELEMKERVCNICPYISLPNSIDLLMRELSKNLRQNLNKYMRKIEEKYKVQFKRHDELGYSTDEAMKVFIMLHQKRWQSEGMPGAFGDKGNKFRDFHMDVAKRFAEKGWLGLYFLTANDEPISVQYTFQYGQRMYYYLAGLDTEYSGYSVGNLIIKFLLEECIKMGFEEYDLMRGDEPYKTRWTSKCRRNLEMRFIRKGLLSRLYNWITWNNAASNVAGKLNLSLTQVMHT